jgi:hypothetical protein
MSEARRNGAKGSTLESGRDRNGKRRQRDAEWCNADMVKEERRSWQVQDGRVEEERWVTAGTGTGNAGGVTQEVQR